MDLFEKIERLLLIVEFGDPTPRVFEELAQAQKELNEYFKNKNK